MDRPVTPSMTENQLAWTSEQIERASKTAARAAARRVLKCYTRGALVGFLILLGGVGASIGLTREEANNRRGAIVESGRTVSVDGCNRDFRDRQEIRATLIASRREVRAQEKLGILSNRQVTRAKRFYKDRLRHLPLPDCRTAADVLTDDPDAKVRVPTPRYPGDGKK